MSVALYIVFQNEYAAYALVDAFFADGAVLHSIDHSIECFDEVLRTQHDVDSCLYAAHCCFSTGVLLCDGTHFHGVGDDDVVVAQFTAQFVLKYVARHG